MHEQPHPRAGETIKIKAQLTPEGGPQETEITVEDWWDRVYGRSWATANGNPAALNYGARVAVVGLPMDDECFYGKIDGLGFIIHQSEVVEEEQA